MAVNVVIQIRGQIGGLISGHAVKVLERLPERGRLILHRFNPHHRAGSPGNIVRQFDQTFFNDGGDAHTRTITGRDKFCQLDFLPRVRPVRSADVSSA